MILNRLNKGNIFKSFVLTLFLGIVPYVDAGDDLQEQGELDQNEVIGECSEDEIRNARSIDGDFKLFPFLPEEMKQEILLKLPFRDLQNLAKTNKSIRKFILSDAYYNAAIKRGSLTQKITFPMERSLQELKRISLVSVNEPTRNYIPIDDDAYEVWRWETVHRLLDPINQFSEIPSGIFRMGSTRDPKDPGFDPLGFKCETPTWVHLGKEGIQFKIQRTPVTQLLWLLVMGNNPSHFSAQKDCPGDHMILSGISLCPFNPVERVTWNEISERDVTGEYKIRTFLRTLKDQFGIEARLPTEAEREMATRGAATQEEMFDLSSTFYRPYFFGTLGDNFANLNKYAWWEGNSGGRTHRVAEKLPNSLGLFDIVGNVWEWVEDWFIFLYPTGTKDNPLVNPKGPNSDYRGRRVVRGEPWNTDYMRSSFRSARRINVFRSYDNYMFRSFAISFRLVIEVPSSVKD